MIKRLEDLAYNALVIVEVVAHLAVLAPVGVTVIAIDLAAELQRRGRDALKRRFQ